VVTVLKILRKLTRRTDAEVLAEDAEAMVREAEAERDRLERELARRRGGAAVHSDQGEPASAPPENVTPIETKRKRKRTPKPEPKGAAIVAPDRRTYEMQTEDGPREVGYVGDPRVNGHPRWQR
jgi:hypothetical protein